MSTTPITDANEYKVWSEGNFGMGDKYAEIVVPVEIAQQLENSLVEATRLLRQVTSDIKWVMGTRAGVSAFNLAEIRNDIEQADKYLANRETP